MIQVLDKLLIDQIAAGEVVERPLSIVKELVENAIDAGSDAITVEIRDGGITLIRITDNGCGIDKTEVPTAFLRHATSKIRTSEDLRHIMSLGFRGEALSSIAAVSKVELITRTYDSIIGCRYVIEGGEEISFDEIGCPEGTTFIVRDLFYNTPARREFLRSAVSEGNSVVECIRQFSLSHPGIRFQLIVDGKPKLQTAGDGKMRTSIHVNFGSDLTRLLIPAEGCENGIALSGFIAKPEFSRGTRSYMYYFVNGRLVNNKVIQAAIDDSYRPFLMSHRFPFTALILEIPPDTIDVNVHPTKKEIRFQDDKRIYDLIYHTLSETLETVNIIPEETLVSHEQIRVAKSINAPVLKRTPEPFEQQRIQAQAPSLPPEYPEDTTSVNETTDNTPYQVESPVLKEENAPDFRIIGQVFDTYWMIEYRDEMLIIDQHAAHEKVLYERLLTKMRTKQGMSQKLLSPVVVSLSGREMTVLENYRPVLEKLGYCFEDFGDREYRISSVPADFLNLDAKEMFIDLLDSLLDERQGQKPEMIIDRLATISCKAAVKGNTALSTEEARTLIGEMLTLEEPYHCPHGRPTTIAMNRYEFDKKFKRIV